MPRREYMMKKCVILTPLYGGEEKDWLAAGPEDMLICADGGYDAALAAGLTPDLVVGDFDSMPDSHLAGCTCPIVRLPVHKDDTDTVVCLKEGRSRGYRRFIIAGTLGGRFDHTLSNVQVLYDCALRGEEAWLCDRQNRVRVLLPGEYTLEALPGTHLSLLAWTERVTGIDLSGTEWPLRNATLTSRYPLGCSNNALEDTVRLRFVSGALVLVWSRENGTV